MNADVTGASLTAASVTLNGTRTGISNIKLSSCRDAVFDGTDTQHGSTVASDPGASPADFSGFASSIATGGTYYFVTADLRKVRPVLYGEPLRQQ
ncbi:MAG: hypothetical protein U5N56_02790 [Candidatus Marinimicrobia bacterium]|nr:hypothetical protein [Candidatus Neomarinimicrobiota bacterium]